MIIKYYSTNLDIKLEKTYELDVGFDLKANLKTDNITIDKGEIKLIPTGIHLILPNHVEAQIRPRSGLALNHGITVLNAPGTVDPGYRGEIKVILINHSKDPYVIKHKERIAQLVFAQLQKVTLLPSVIEQILTKPPNGSRNNNGFGSSGK